MKISIIYRNNQLSLCGDKKFPDGVEVNPSPITGQIFIEIPFIQHQIINRHKVGTTKVEQEERIAVSKDVGKISYFQIDDFFDHWFKSVLFQPKYKRRTLRQKEVEIVSCIQHNMFKHSLRKILEDNKKNIFTTEAWRLGTEDCVVEYQELNGKIFEDSPIDKIRENENTFKDNPHKDPNHPLYTFLNPVEKTPDDLRYAREFFHDFQDIILPESRRELMHVLLDYFFASMFKHEIKMNLFARNVAFLFLIVVGQKATGKTWMAQNIMKLVYGQASEEIYTYNKSNFSGSSPMTRVNLQYNNTLPLLCEEIGSLGSMEPIINTYITQGTLQDCVNTRGNDGNWKKTTRKSFHSPIVLTNNIEFIQQGSNAIMDRLLIFQTDLRPQQDSSIVEKSKQFSKKYQGREQEIGNTIIWLLKNDYDNFVSTIRKKMSVLLRKKLDDEKNITIESSMDERILGKFKFMLIGKFIKEYVFDKLEVKSTGISDEQYFEYVTNTSVASGVTSQEHKLAVQIYDILYEVDRYTRQRVYDLPYLFDEPRKRKKQWEDVFVNKKDIGSSENQKFLEILFKLKQIGVYPTNDYAYFVVRGPFLGRLSLGQYKETSVTVAVWNDIASRYTFKTPTRIDYHYVEQDSSTGEYYFVTQYHRATATFKMGLFHEERG